MAIPDPERNLVICYSYLWYSEYNDGREEGIKNRPCVIVSAIPNEDKLFVTVVPITHTAPNDPEGGVEMPASVKKQLGLDEIPFWIITSQFNRFVWPGTDLRRIPSTGKFAYGFLPPSLFKQAGQKLLACMKAQRLRSVFRTGS